MLTVSGLGSGYGEVQVLHNLNFSVGKEVLAVLGANGAGKSTLLKTLARLLPLRSGEMTWQGESISKMPAHEIAARGVAYVPQEHNVFPNLSVAENLSLGTLVGEGDTAERFDEVYGLFPRLAERKEQAAGSLSGGEGQMLAVGRALMQNPGVILLDEPSAGLSPLYVDLLFEKIVEVREARDVSIVLAEQNASKTLGIADRVLVLSLGQQHKLEEASSLTTGDLKSAYHI